MGIDFEFNTKIAALIQICFEGFKIIDDRTIYSFIFIFDPNQLNKDDMNCLIKNYLINNKYLKLLHGAESLDVPYLFETILKNNKGYIKQFTNLKKMVVLKNLINQNLFFTQSYIILKNQE